MHELAELWPSSGMSKKEYAKRHGIGNSTLHYWLKRSGEQGEVVSKTGVGKQNLPAFVKVGVVENRRAEELSGLIIITLPSGTRIEVR